MMGGSIAKACWGKVENMGENSTLLGFGGREYGGWDLVKNHFVLPKFFGRDRGGGTLNLLLFRKSQKRTSLFTSMKHLKQFEISN